MLPNGTLLHFEYADSPGDPWVPLLSAVHTNGIVQTNGRVFFVDLSPSLTEQRLYRVWADYKYSPWLSIASTTAIYLSGSVGTRLHIDYLNAIGPPDAWLPLDIVTITSPTELYSNDAMLGKPGNLYRVAPVP